MKFRAGACLKRQQAYERTFFIEQPATARTGIERCRGANHIAAIEWIKPFDGALMDDEIASAGKTRSDDALPGTQRGRCPDRHRRKAEVGNSNEAEIVVHTARLDGRNPALGSVHDLDGVRLACD